jgi:hypothetical protein
MERIKRLSTNLESYQNQKQAIESNVSNYYYTKETKEYGAWNPSSYSFSAGEIASQYCGWWHTIKWKSQRYGLHMRHDYGTKESIRSVIANKISKSLDEIYTDLHYEGREEGNPT